MSMITLVVEMMVALRIKNSESAMHEVSDLIHSCIADLNISGVYITDISDSLFKQSVKLYCKANYGYDENQEKYNRAYQSLKDSMALSGDYSKHEQRRSIVDSN